MNYARKARETTDLRILADLRSEGRLIEGKQKVRSDFYARKKEYLTPVLAEAKRRGMSATAITERKSEDGESYFVTTLSKVIPITSLQTLFALSKSFQEIADKNELYYDYWTIGSN